MHGYNKDKLVIKASTITSLCVICVIFEKVKAEGCQKWIQSPSEQAEYFCKSNGRHEQTRVNRFKILAQSGAACAF